MCSHYWLISVCNVCSRGGDREAVIRGIDIDKNQIHVHYVGGSEDDDDDPSFIVLPGSKFSFRCIPVWDWYSPHQTRVEGYTTYPATLVPCGLAK